MRLEKTAAFASACLLLAGFAAAQQPTNTAAPAAAAQAVPSNYVVGPNDVLAMSVFGAPELDDSAMRVDRSGTVHTPYGTTPVHVAGMTLSGVRKAIAAELVRDRLAVDPRVEVSVVEAESHPVLITGLGITRPGTIQAIQPIRLLDAINLAGGLKNNNAAEIKVIRPGPDGAAREQVFTAAQVMSSGNPEFDPLLYGGEQVRVIPDGDAYVAGAVKSPGAFPITSADPLTIRKALAKAHGLLSTAKAGQAQLIRNVGEPDQVSTRIDLPKILDGKLPDVPLAANDMVYVPQSGVKKVTFSFLTHTAEALTFAAGTALAH